MSKYTTGEIAKLCGVTVRTVQYYDTRGILIPTELTEGGRRLYSEDDLKRMRIICFLRELGLPIDSISQLLSESDPGSVISLLLQQQEQALKEEITERQEKLDKLETHYHGKTINKNTFLLRTMSRRGAWEFCKRLWKSRLNLTNLKSLWDVKR